MNPEDGRSPALPPSMAALRLMRPWFPALYRFAPPLARRLAARLFCTPIRGRRPSPRSRAVLRAAEVGSIAVEGRHVRYWRWGTGPNVFLVHGGIPRDDVVIRQAVAFIGARVAHAGPSAR